jgi:PhoH-like ATPase
MKDSKKYIIDTNVLIDNPNAIENLLDSNKNKVTIPINVLKELDNLKTDNKIGHLVRKAIKNILEHYEKNEITFLNINDDIYLTPDGKILNELINNKDAKDSIFLSNDKMFSLLSKELFKQTKQKITVEEYKNTKEYISDPKLFTGILTSSDTKENQINASNFFTWDKSKGTLIFNSIDGERDTQFNTNPHNVWKVKPRHYTQHMAFDLLLNDNIDLVSIQGNAGYGKTMCALAAGLYLVLEKKKYEKIVFIKSNHQVGGVELGFLPGNLDEKLEPYNEYVKDLLFKLHNIRRCDKIWEGDPKNKKIDDNKFKIIPINFVRGMNLDNCYCIIDECQNLSQSDIKTMLTRMGEKVKCVVMGDVKQIDNPKLNEYNNGLSVLVRNLISKPNYAHIQMSGKHSRGPIADLILNSEI